MSKKRKPSFPKAARNPFEQQTRDAALQRAKEDRARQARILRRLREVQHLILGPGQHLILGKPDP
jgi:hypothetical protein